jgi:hypothetical protein
MAKNKVYIDIVVDDKGTTKKVAISAKKLEKALQGTGRAAQTTDRNLKGAAQASSNGTKNFAKMAQGIGGTLVPAYATLAANVFAVTAAFSALQKTAQVNQLEETLVRTGELGGRNLTKLSQKLIEVTGYAVGAADSLKTTAFATAQGFSDDQLLKLTKVARGASIALGRDLGDALDRITRGTAKLEPEILDELGIIVRLDEASKNYAESLGKTAKDLTQFQKQQAFTNAVIDQGMKKFGDAADSAEVNPYDKLSASFSNLNKTLFTFINIVLTPLISFLSQNSWALGGALAVFASTIVNQLTPALSDLSNTGRKEFASLATRAKKEAIKIENAFVTASKKVTKAKFTPPKGFKDVEPDIRAGIASASQLEKAKKSLISSDTQRSRILKNLQKEVTSLRGTERAAHEALIKQKTKELSVIKQQQIEIKELQRLQSKPLSSKSVAKSQRTSANTRVQSRVARTEAAAFKLFEGKNFIQQLGVAKAATMKMAVQVGSANGVLAKLSTGFKVAGASAKLFGTAVLNAIPVIGQIIFVLTLVFEALNALNLNPFEESEAEKKTREFAESLDFTKKSTVTVNKELAKTGDIGVQAFIKLNAGVNQFKESVSALDKTFEDTRTKTAERLKEIEKELSPEGFIGVSKSLLLKFFATADLVEGRIKRLNQEKDELVKGGGFVDTKELQTNLKAIQTEFKNNEFLPQSVMNEMDNFINNVVATGEVTVHQARAMTEAFNRLPDPFQTWIKSIESLNDATKVVTSNITNLLKKTDNKFTPLLDSTRSLKNEILNIVNTNLESPLTKTLIKEKAGIESLEFIEKLLKKQEFTRENIRKEVEKYFNLIQKTEKIERTLQADLKDVAAQRKEISKFTKNSVFFALEDKKLQEQALILKIRSLDTIIEAFGAEENTLQLEIERRAVQRELQSLKEDSLIEAQATFNQLKRIYDIENKVLSVKKEQDAIRLKSIETAQSERLRKLQKEFTFEFTDNGRTKANQAIEKQKIIVENLRKNEDALVATKTALLDAEWALLKRQLAAERAKLPEGSVDAENLTNLIAQLNSAQGTARDNIKDSGREEVLAQEAVLAKLKDKKEALYDINQIVNTVEDSLTSGLTSAFDSVIQGTMSMKDAFRQMATDILRSLSQVIELRKC